MLRGIRVCAAAYLALAAALAASIGMIGQVVVASAAQSGPASLAVDQLPVAVNNNVSGILYQPHEPGQRNSTGVVVMHSNGDYQRVFVCEGLASHGYTVLCVNNRYQNLPSMVNWDNLALDVKAAVTYLKQQPGISKALLFGHSGGGNLMPWYQAVAENGIGICNDSRKIDPCSNALAEMPPADGLILMDPTPGQPFIQLIGYDPKVTTEDQFGKITPGMMDPSLDMFSSDNGFSQTNPSYSEEFESRFFAGQAARAERLTALAQSRTTAIANKQGLYTDNEPFIVGYHNANLFSYDKQIWSHTKVAHPLIRPAGVQQTVVESIRPLGISVNGNLQAANASYGQVVSLAGALKSDVNAFISGAALHVDPTRYRLTDDDILGVDWASTNASTPYNIAHIHAPMLILGATGHYWVVTAEIYYDMTPSTDKTVAFVYGATHGYSPCKDCGAPLSAIGDTQAETLAYIAAWLEPRFGGR
jgi:pimeloyl-ACP methyl ester carboxylesterase